MSTSLGGQGTTAKNYWDDSNSALCSTKYVSDTGGSAIRINGDGLLDNTLVCKDPYCLDACGCWQPATATITMEEDFANQLAAQIAKKINEKKDPLVKNSDVDEVEIPSMSGFIEI